MLRRVAPDANFPGKLAGVVLCGGRSVRMGRDKALIEVHGEPLWHRQWRQLSSVTGQEPWVSVRAGAALASGQLQCVYDDGSSGPLGGILATLAAMETFAVTHVAVLAVDLPLMEPSWWTTLARACDERAGAVGRMKDGGWEPLAAIYPVGMEQLFREAKERGQFSLQKMVEAGVAAGLLRDILIEREQENFFENWNLPGDVK